MDLRVGFRRMFGWVVPSDLSYLWGSALCEFYTDLFRGIECCEVLIELIEYSLHEELHECSTAV